MTVKLIADGGFTTKTIYNIRKIETVKGQFRLSMEFSDDSQRIPTKITQILVEKE